MSEQEEHPDKERADIGDPLLDSGEETKSMDAIRSGLHIRKPECGDFWEDFISLTGNADAMAELLEVPREKVTSWASKIREMVDKVKSSDEQDDDSEKSEMIPTGNSGPVAGDNTPAPDRRPMPS